MSNTPAVTNGTRKRSRAPWILGTIVAALVVLHLFPQVRAFEAGFINGFTSEFTKSFNESYEKARAGR